MVLYNPIFEKLVIETDPDSRERLIGMIAYSDYKEEKYQWKEQYRARHKVADVPPDAVENFLLAYHDGKLNKLRNDSEELLYVFAEHYAEKWRAQSYEDGREDELVKQVRSQKDGWWVAGLKGALCSMMFAVSVILVSIFFSLASPDANYSKLIQFIIGEKEFLVLANDDCRLKDVSKDCDA